MSASLCNRLRRAGLALALVLWVLPAPGRAEGKEYAVTDTATVIEIDREAKRIRVKPDDVNAPETTYVLEGPTRIIRDGDSIPFSALEEGERVVVNAHGGLSGEDQVADYIRVVRDPDVAAPDEAGERDETPEKPDAATDAAGGSGS